MKKYSCFLLNDKKIRSLVYKFYETRFKLIIVFKLERIRCISCPLKQLLTINSPVKNLRFKLYAIFVHAGECRDSISEICPNTTLLLMHVHCHRDIISHYTISLFHSTPPFPLHSQKFLFSAPKPFCSFMILS